ncbi:PucR C-terminal helix-turn-helix domain-containing protein [Amycolatopsis arida]|uniref:PucR C-terminal helix-turn-helix domain-containing protein n=1 Tax=Amycolatopsis arida TaxID=587909 RepID=A0A1I5K674_9PSEU|nr:helix-turn-helix domain-containing protein [Amycolatopsis arida]TDX96903.1 PucR-like helix-turn-helix protein [Amycolatopsis arida]SFO80519.1 PucR C-terminal helix-turn-helix domain-containing protein [Amycolatopsis arida]
MTVGQGLDRAPAALPRKLADIFRPELASLSAEIVDEIRATIPAYARPMDGPYGRSIRSGVRHAITLFVEQIADPATSKAHSHEVHRKLGQNEMRAGRSLDALQAAYRVGARVAWRRIMRVGRRAGLSSAVMSQLADAMLAFMDELASVALDGYLEAKASTADARETWRRRLLQLILERPPAPAEAIAELAQLVGWVVPERVAPVAVQYPPGAGRRHPVLEPEILAELGGLDPHLLVPGELTTERLAELRAALPGCRLAVGPPVPPPAAADSLRWARRALLLVGEGVLPDRPVTFVAGHLATLLLHADVGLVDQLRQRLLAPLADLTPRQRERMVETLRAWLAAQGNVLDVASVLGVHPQTVRYRMRRLHAAFGARLDDPTVRFELELVLRAQPSVEGPSVTSPTEGVANLLPRPRQHGTRANSVGLRR